jgi:hypothetical protein
VRFYDASGTRGMTTEELDRVALESAGWLYSTGYGYACPVSNEVIPGAPEWGTRVVNTQGMGNYGDIILVGRTLRTRELLREGKKRFLVRHGVPEDVAEVARSMQYGMEIEVASLAAEIIWAVQHRGPFQGRYHRAFNAWCDLESCKLSFPRKLAAANIAAAVAQRRPKVEAISELGSLGKAILVATKRLEC